MDRINELLARIAELTDEELAELSTLIAAEADTLAEADPTDETVAGLTALADAQDVLNAETANRETAQTARVEARDAALQRLRPVATEETEGAEDDGQAAEVVAETAEVLEEPQAVAAAATRPAATTRPRPTMTQLAGARPAANRPGAGTTGRSSRLTVTATATGQELATRMEMGETLSRAFSNGRRTSEDPVITATVDFPENRLLRTGHDADNDALIASLFEPEALVAAGGLCAPIENLYDVRVTGSTSRPARDALTTMGITRGGVNLRQPPVFQDWDGAIGDWTFQNDIDAATAGGSDPTKPILEALCPGFVPFYVEATTERVRFRNVTARFDPEGTAGNMDATAVAFARKAELKLLSKMAALSMPVTGAKTVSAARDILARLDQVLAYWIDRRRIDPATRFRLFLTQWVRNMIRTDLLRGADYDLDALAVADQAIDDWFGRRNITVTWTLDGRAANQGSGAGVPAIARQSYAQVTAASAIPGYPAQIEMLLSIEGDFLFLDAGEINLGIVRDTTTNAVNAYEMFREEFFGVGFRGVEALQIVLSTEPTGQRAAPLDTSGLTD